MKFWVIVPVRLVHVVGALSLPFQTDHKITEDRRDCMGISKGWTGELREGALYQGMSHATNDGVLASM